MRQFLSAALLAAPLAFLAQPASADVRCYQDGFGNVRCSGDNGSSLRQTSFGNYTRTTINDGYGNTTHCRTYDYGMSSRTTCN